MKNKCFIFFTMFILLVTTIISCSSKSESTKDATNMEAYEEPSYNMETETMPLSEQKAVRDSIEEDLDNNTEQYNAIKENKFILVKDCSTSTFSADVDTASYTKFKSMIQEGDLYNTSSLRIEEMLNYFHYNYVGPKTGEPFGINTEVGVCPWNQNSKILSIGLQAKELDSDNFPKSNLVFLLDTSGSMADVDKLPLMVQAFKLLVAELGENDRISIVTYAGSDEILLEGKNGDDKLEIVNALENLTAEGSTNGSAGIQTAYELAEKYYIQGGNNRVILATDGDLNVGVTSEDGLTELIEEKRELGIYLSVLGLGAGNYKDNNLEALADNGNGNYNYIDSRQEAKKVLVEEMGGTLVTVAKDVKLQVEFDPDTVESYRLIGYENRMLRTEDFKDDTKDAGELGAGHQVTALYEIVLKGNDAGELGTLHLRYKKPTSDTSSQIDYSIQTVTNQSSSNNLRFACAVAQTGMLLRNSEYIKSGSYEDILTTLNSLPITDDPYKMEFKDLVDQLRIQLESKE